LAKKQNIKIHYRYLSTKHFINGSVS